MVERSASLPVFTPPGLAPERAQLQPDVVQVHLSEEEQCVFVIWVGLQLFSRKGLAAGRLRQERGHESRTDGASVPRGRLVALSRFSERLLDLKEQAGCAQFARLEGVTASRTEDLRQGGGLVVVAVIKESLRLFQCTRLRIDGLQRQREDDHSNRNHYKL